MPFGLCSRPPGLEQRGHIVGGGHVAPAARGRKGGIAVAGGDVEHAAACAQVERFAQVLTDDLQRGTHDRIVAGGPGGLLAGLDCGEIDGGRGSGNDCGHGCTPVM